jgi:L-glyceraldehyde 3-phosphate reductase
MALAWALRDERVTSVLVGASSVAQLEENLAAAGQAGFTREELAAISHHGAAPGSRSDINIWAASSAEPRTDSFSAIRPGT